MSEPAAAPIPRKAIYTLMLINFVDLMGFGLVLLLLPFYALRFGATTGQVVLLQMVFSFCSFIGSPILGAWSDRIGRRPVLIISQWGSVVGYLVLALATIVPWADPKTGLYVLFLSRIIDGFTAGNVTITNAYIADVVPAKDRAGTMGLLGAAFGLGFTVGPPIGGFLGSINHALPGILAAILCAVASLMVWRFLPESHTDRSKTGAGTFAFSKQRLDAVRGEPMVLWLSLVWLLSMLAYVTLETSIPLMLQQRFGFDEFKAGCYFGAVGLIIIFVQGGLIRPLKKRFGEWPLSMMGAACAVVGFALYARVAVTPLIWLIGIAAIFNAFGRSLQTPTLSSMLSQNAKPGAQGSAYGIYQGMGSLGRMFGPLLVWAFYDRNPSFLFLLSGGLIVLAAIVLIAIRPRLTTSGADRPVTEVPVTA